MAKGRMLNTGVSLSVQVAELPTATARLLFTWAIAHLDRDGRITCDPRRFRALVCPLLDDVTVSDVGESLAAMVERGLVVAYVDHDGNRVAWFTGFGRGQPGMKYDREARSKYGEPPNSGVSPDQVRSWSGSSPDLVRSTPAERNLTEQNRTEDPPNPLRGVGGALELFPDEPSKPSPVDLVWKAYDGASKAAGRTPFKRTTDRDKRIKARVADLGLDAVLSAVRGCWLDEWAKPGGKCGSPAGKCEPEHVLRNVANAEKYAAVWESLEKSKPTAPTPADRVRGQAALDAIVAEKRARLQAAKDEPGEPEVGTETSGDQSTRPGHQSVAANGNGDHEPRRAS